MSQDAQPSIPGLPTAAQPAAGEGATLQPGTTADGAAPGPAPTGGGGSLIFFIPLIGTLILMMVLSGRAQKKEQKKKAELLASLHKHDKIQTIGGIIGSISEIRDDEVVLVIDEQSKTKMRVAKSAVQQVLRSSQAGGNDLPAENAAPQPELVSTGSN